MNGRARKGTDERTILRGAKKGEEVQRCRLVLTVTAGVPDFVPFQCEWRQR